LQWGIPMGESPWGNPLTRNTQLKIATLYSVAMRSEPKIYIRCTQYSVAMRIWVSVLSILLDVKKVWP
jgi:hypothetical protein